MWSCALSQGYFYKKLYQSNDTVTFEYVDNVKKLDIVQCVMVENGISEKEIYESICKMLPERTPGLDGIPKEFYQKFFYKIKLSLMRLYEVVLKHGILNPSARKGLITLLPKRNHNRLLLKSWRPLTMLNLDYKILAKVLAERMKLVLDSVISPEQTGFRAGKDICENIRHTLKTIDYSNKKQNVGEIISIDFEKCFDRVEHKSVLAAMRYFGFLDHFVSWIGIFFKEFYLVTQNYGFLSDPFLKGRGVNQGCPVSPFCYLVMGELIAHKIKSN